MALYEMRTYTFQVGKLAEAVALYRDEGWPVLEREGLSANLIGYFTADTGTLHRLVHLWKFDDDADRRAFWARLYGSEAFMGFAGKIRPNMLSQEVVLLNEAPFGPHP